MDPILLPYVQATDEIDKESRLEQLLLFIAAPEIRFTMRRILGFHVSQQGINPQNQDAEDLYQEVMTKSVGILRELDASLPIEIENFKQYVNRIAINECNNFLRNSSPARSRLKTNLRQVLTHQRAFALWKFRNQTLVGLATWRGMQKSESWPPADHSLKDELERFRDTRFPGTNVKHVSLKRLVSEFFQWAGGAVEFESLVVVVATLLDVKDAPVESLDAQNRAWIETHIEPSVIRTSSRLDEEAMLRQLWASVKTLPPNQRIAFCFRCEGDSGQGLLSLLRDSKIFTLAQLAREFGRTVEEMSELLLKMPMDPTAVAREMKTTRQQVNKWHFHAQRQLRKQLLQGNKSSS